MGNDAYMIGVLLIRYANMAGSVSQPNGIFRHMVGRFNLLG